MRTIAVPEALYSAIVRFLSTCPYGEVANMMDALGQCPPIRITEPQSQSNEPASIEEAGERLSQTLRNPDGSPRFYRDPDIDGHP